MDVTLTRPVAKGYTYRISQRFGENPADYADIKVRGIPLAGHNGLDIAVIVGSPILAAHAGIIAAAGFDPGGYGNYIVVRAEAEGIWTRYAHLRRTLAILGAFVLPGTVLGESGNTGRSDGPHLHFELGFTRGVNPAYGDRIDPFPFIVW